jgi:long-subunit acyl-CoA synthetase (AMP-forming)
MDTVIDERARHAVFADDIIAARDAGTLWGLFRERVRRSPSAMAYREYSRSDGGWRDHTWSMISARVDRFRAALALENMQAGDRVAALLPNGIDWVCLDLAAHGSGLIVVGLYPHDTAASNAYILGHSDARLLLVDTEARWKSLRPLRAEFPSLARVWVRDVESGAERPRDPDLHVRYHGPAQRCDAVAFCIAVECAILRRFGPTAQQRRLPVDSAAGACV